eukprot:scaffold222955_cov24-Tisochrysis_lutea.AAC.1
MEDTRPGVASAAALSATGAASPCASRCTPRLASRVVMAVARLCARAFVSPESGRPMKPTRRCETVSASRFSRYSYVNPGDGTATSGRRPLSSSGLRSPTILTLHADESNSNQGSEYANGGNELPHHAEAASGVLDAAAASSSAPRRCSSAGGSSSSPSALPSIPYPLWLPLPPELPDFTFTLQTRV